MELKSRPAYILKIILEQKNGYTVDRIIEKLNITKRTFYYDFELINDWLKSRELGRLEIQSKIICVKSKKIEILEAEMRKNGSYYYSVQERRILELLMILLSAEVVTIEKMQNLFDVSKNTILKDIKEWKKILGNQNISIASSIKFGYVLQGEEFAIRKIVGKEIKKLQNFQPKDILKKWMQQSLVTITGEDYDYLEIARCLIKQYEQDENIKLVLENEELECSMILISWIRSMDGYTMNLHTEEKVTLVETKPYQSLKQSFEKLKVYNLEIPESEIYYIATLLLGIKVAQFVSQDQEDLYISNFTKALVVNFERIACISFDNKDRLMTRLKGHIRPLYYRLKYGVQSTNPLVQDVMRMYPEIYDFTGRAVREMKDDLAKMLTSDEIAYLTIYFISDEKYQTIQKKSNVSKVLVLCADGMATSTLVKEQLKTLFGSTADIKLGIISEAKKYNLDDFALIISTGYSELLAHRKNIVFTNVILEDSDKKKIIQVMNQCGVIGEYNKTIQRIISAAVQSTNGIVDENELYFDVLRILFESDNRKIDKKLNSIANYIQNQRYSVLPERSTKEELLMQGCQKAVGEKAWKRLYNRLCNMMNHNKIKFYEISQDVVILHCPMRGDLNVEINYEIVVSEERIKISEEIKGKIFIFFVTVDQNTHFPVLEGIYRYCESEKGKSFIADMKGVKK